TRLTDIVVKDAVELEKSTTGLENIIERFRFLMSVQEAVIFEYSSITNRFYVYSFDYNVNTVFLNEDFDYFRFHALSEGLIAESSRETFESFFESVKAGISRFSFEMESGIITGGDQTSVQIFSGFSETDSDGNRVVLGLITAKKTVEDPLAAAGPAFEANLDPLTRLFNKKTVTNYARNHITSGENKSVTIAIIDIDDFKYINDTYGHLFGDDIICTAASVIKKETGSKGTAGRIGGDEFMVVLDDVPGEMEIRSILRAIRSNIGMLCAEKAEGLKITCSMGIARFPDDAPSYEQLFRTADKALYIAKEKGKDRYVIYNREKHGAVEETDSGAITTALSGDRRNTDKTDVTGSLITGLTVDGSVTVPEALMTIVPAFDIDRIRIYTGDDLKLTHSYPASENSESADYLMSDGYTDNFTPAGMFVMDNTDILEGRNPGAFARMKADGVKAAVQYISFDGENINGMISFELTRLFKKWPQMDVSFMNILGKVIFKKL
ncbi:MAG: GGDEF domain-containing protein, partial [Oscillospiraceae bacterium]|nr:GGDEF domain-containing protein [Oscillospiraceae bacterium]